MNTTLAEKAETAVSTFSGEALNKLIMNGDLSKLNDNEKSAYYVYRCKQAGLDPATKPFDLLKLQGKEVLYATRECSAQIANRDRLSVEVVSEGAVGDVYKVHARAVTGDGRHTDDIGAVSIKGLGGDALCNAIMKATTKAKRRAVLSHAGLGMLDESEMETLPKEPLVVVDTSPTKPVKQYTLKPRPEPAPAPVTEALSSSRGEGDAHTDTVPSTESSAPPPAPTPEPPTPRGGEMAQAVIQAYSKAGRKTANGHESYGIMVSWDADNQEWGNTFDKSVWETAKGLKGHTAIVTFSRKAGRDRDFLTIHHIAGVDA